MKVLRHVIPLLIARLAYVCRGIHVLGFGSTQLELLASKEARRYLGLLSTSRSTLKWHPEVDGLTDLPFEGLGSVPVVVVATRGHAVHDWLGVMNSSYTRTLQELSKPDSHLITTVEIAQQGSVLVCVGATPRGTLYAVYALMEHFGVRFYLDGDVIPARVDSLLLPTGIHQLFTPRFEVRGLQPFHDFPMGPDFWQPQFWRALATNMAKMKMNFYGFHTYPIAPPGKSGITEPLVWIGTASGYNHSNGAILASGAYDTSWYQTEDFWATGTHTTRGNVPGQQSVATSSFCCGASLAFERDCYGSEAQADVCYPTKPELSAKVFNNAADLLRGALDWGLNFGGVDGAIGIEFPLQMPQALIAANTSLQVVYEGIFKRIIDAKIPISTFWLWTTEAVEDHSTGKGYPQSNPLWKQLVQEIRIAQAAKATVGANFSLGTNGWCLGPGDNASFFASAIADKTFKISAISGSLGWLPPDPAFQDMDGARAWVIPWMEDDISLAGAELWVNRTLEHASLAHSYGASGLLGLTWRTWETSLQIAALARSGWSETAASLTDRSFLLDHCASNFGRGAASDCAELFLQVDSFSDSYKPGTGFDAGGSKLPRDGQACCGGPMNAVSVPESHLLNVTGFEVWLKTVVGVENIQRATAWVNHFRYHRQTQIVADATAALQKAMRAIHDVESAKKFGLPLAAAVRDAYARMITLLLETTTTPGTLGMIAAHEGANWPSVFGAAVAPLAKFLPPEVMQTLSPSRAYGGAPRLYRSAVRSVVASEEGTFELEVVVLSPSPPADVNLHIGGASITMHARTDPLSGTVHSQVYMAQVPIPEDDFEYFVTARFDVGESLRLLMERAETVVVMPSLAADLYPMWV